MARNAFLIFGSFALILLVFTTGYGQQTPLATSVAARHDAKAEAPKTITKLQMREAIETKTKSIWREPAWYVSIAGSALDIAGSAASIDGKRVREGNPLFTRSDGKVAWERAIPFTAASMYMQYKLYQNPKHRKWAIVSMVATGVMRGAFGGARAFAHR
ncbi:MAG TPA: hypothetical protein VF131_24360 [Blastocatellia bacterium]|nr:hypothetical protein [Blastocatellia bacterium]